MSTPTPISCDIHDHLELACMRGYELEIQLHDGSLVTGRATTTRTSPEKVEYLVVTADNQPQDVPMHEMARLRVLTPGASFQTLTFTDHCG